MKKRLVMLVGLLIVVAFITIVATALNNAQPKPSEGWTLHIDSEGHFPGNPDMIAHHYCKPGVDGLVAECQLYASDSPNAILVGVEVVVSPETYNNFSEKEKALWHYHKTEIPRQNVTLPDLSPEEAALVIKSLEETYGKVYLLWDPSKNNLPVGNPMVSIVDHGGKDKDLEKKKVIQQSTSEVRMLSDGSVVPDASSMLVRTKEGITMKLHTSELNAHDAVTIWWVIFNKPENCTEGEFDLRCGAGDLSNPETQPSVMFAAGSITNAKGNAIFGGHLSVGDTKGCPPGFPCSGGLTDPMGADIHLVVRDHGPIVPELLHEQISTFGGGCSNAPPGTGKPGPNICNDVQFSAHEAALDP